MRKGVLKELVLLALNGGELNDESAVMLSDIEAYLPAAVNYAMSKNYNINIQVENQRDLSSLFYGVFYDLVIERPLGRFPRVTLPKGTVALPRNQGIRFVTDNCENIYAPLSDNDLRTIKYYRTIFPGSKFFRLKQTWIELFEINPLVEKINMEMIVRVEDLDEDDELPIGAGLEDDVINLCLQHFDPQRKQPADKINDTNDINATK